MNIKDFINFDFIKVIIAELKEIRKGAWMIVLTVCTLLALFDHFILGNIFNTATANLFQKIYGVGFIFSLTSVLIKAYNAICDYNDTQKEAKGATLKKQEKEKEYRLELKKHYRLALNALSEEEIKIIKRLIKEEDNLFILHRNYAGSAIANKFSSFGIAENIKKTEDSIVGYIKNDFLEYSKKLLNAQSEATI